MIIIMKKKLLAVVLAAVLSMAAFAGCSPKDNQSPDNSSNASSNTSSNGNSNASSAITVISREPGSGTRSAFIELLGVEEKDSEGNKVDHTTKEAIIANKTDVMLTQVAGNKNAIGYISLGSLNDTVKALKVDGAEATVENIKNGSYKVSRPFNIVTKGEGTDLAQDFISFIMSSMGQQVVVDNKYIAVDEAAAEFKSNGAEGKLVIAGSSSVYPVMEKLVEAYKTINTKATIELQQSDSTAGVQSTIDGVADIGMASRELKDSEKAELNGTTIAIDGIAIIVNNENASDELSSEAIKNIYTGATTNWADVK